MASITFDEITEAVNKEFDHLNVDFHGTAVQFRNVLQLAKAERDEIGELLKVVTGSDEDEESDAGEKQDSEEAMRQILTIAAQEKDACKQLLDGIGENAAQLLHVFKLYIGATEVPEA